MNNMHFLTWILIKIISCDLYAKQLICYASFLVAHTGKRQNVTTFDFWSTISRWTWRLSILSSLIFWGWREWFYFLFPFPWSRGGSFDRFSIVRIFRILRCWVASLACICANAPKSTCLRRACIWNPWSALQSSVFSVYLSSPFSIVLSCSVIPSSLRFLSACIYVTSFFVLPSTELTILLNHFLLAILAGIFRGAALGLPFSCFEVNRCVHVRVFWAVVC